jgi:2,5-diketo-D-gluconate reductase A
MKTITLNNGIKMPQIGYGVYQISSRECERCVSDALEVGYRSVDTAKVYGNEKAVGDAIRKSSLAREEVFVTTKLYLPSGGNLQNTHKAIDQSLSTLNVDYIDLLLMHEPFNGYMEIYKGMEEAYQQGKVKAIGISNFNRDVYLNLVKSCHVVPAINQVETHVFRQQTQAQKLMELYGTQLESWAPFATGNNSFFSNHTLKRIGENHQKSVSQVGLRYLLQRQIVVIPKSTHKERMRENFNVFDFVLSNEEMKEIAALEIGTSQFSWY